MGATRLDPQGNPRVVFGRAIDCENTVSAETVAHWPETSSAVRAAGELDPVVSDGLAEARVMRPRATTFRKAQQRARSWRVLNLADVLPPWRAGSSERRAIMRVRMSHVGVVAGIAAIACMLAAGAGARPTDSIEASIIAVTPNHAMAGQLVTIAGTGLDGTTAVSFGRVASHSFSAGADAVLAVVPRGVHPGSVYVTVDQSSGTSATSRPLPDHAR
jgi:hypothetical protein